MSEWRNPSDDSSKGDDALDRLLRLSLQNRPEPRPPIDLAHRAMQRARQAQHLAEQQQRQLQIQRWRLRLMSAVAIVLIALLLAAGVKRAVVQYADSQTSATQQDATATTGTDSTSTSSQDTTLLWLGGGVLIATLAGLAGQIALSADRPLPDASQLLRAM